MTLFAASGPRLFALPPGADLPDDFARGLYARLSGHPPELAARVTIMVNSTQAQHVIEQSLADLAPRPGLLPRLKLISNMYASPDGTCDLPPSIPPLRRHLRLVRLVEHFLDTTRKAGEPHAPTSAAAELAEDLANLIDQFHDEGLSAADLDRAVRASDLDAEAASHWQRTLAFIDLVRHTWPEIRNTDEGRGPRPPCTAARRNRGGHIKLAA